MTNKELVDKNIGLTFDFVRYLIDNPEVTEKLPDSFKLEFVNDVYGNYDIEADTVYLHFKKPKHADRTEMTEEEIILRYQENQVIGITILNAGKRNLKI
jgi:uncharacterized protein YuzE